MGELFQLENYPAGLAAELATGLVPAKEVFRRHNYTEQEAEALLRNPYFASMVKQAKEQWESTTNTQERLKMKARIALEEGLVDLYEILANKKEAAAARVAAAKELKDISKIETSEGRANTGLPPITINIGQSAEPITVGETVEHEPVEADPGGDLRRMFGQSNNDDLLHPGGDRSLPREEAEDGHEPVSVELPPL